VTNDEIIELANEANRIVRALDALTGRGDDDPEVGELSDRLHQVMGGVSYPEHPLLRLAMNMLEGKPFGAYSDDPETVRRLDSLAADIGARKKAWTLFPGVVPSTGALYEPPDQH
jgi:hypothetical protein